MSGLDGSLWEADERHQSAYNLIQSFLGEPIQDGARYGKIAVGCALDRFFSVNNSYANTVRLDR